MLHACFHNYLRFHSIAHIDANTAEGRAQLLHSNVNDAKIMDQNCISSRPFRVILILCLTLTITLPFLNTGGECFTIRRIDELKQLALFDLELARLLDRSVRSPIPAATINNSSFHERLDRLRDLADRYLKDFTDANGVDTVEQVDYADLDDIIIGHPVSFYRLIRRCHLLMNQTVRAAKGVLAGQGIFPPDDLIPQPQDIVDAAFAIVNIQRSSLHFNVTQFADGNSGQEKMKPRRSPTLRAVQCVELGNAALRLSSFALAVEWFAEARRRVTTADDRTVPLKIIEQRMTQAVKVHDEAWSQAFSSTVDESSKDTQLRRLNLYVSPVQSVSPERNRTKVLEQLYEKTKGTDVASNIVLNSLGLCNGENLQSTLVKSYLFCWLEFKVHPVFSIGPLKMEFLDRNPDIVQVHNAFYPTDVEEMKGSTTCSSPLWSSHATHERLQDELCSRITRKTGAMLGLNATGSLYTRMPMYRAGIAVGGGSLAGLHVDGFGRRIVEEPEWRFAFSGDIFATVLMYLNTVDKGGRTAFPISGTFAEPIKGSAVFYFNFFSDGLTQDRALLHFGCPVFMGQKWLAYDIIRAHDQFLTKPCLRTPHERFQVPVNGQLLALPDLLRRKLGEDDELALQQMNM